MVKSSNIPKEIDFLVKYFDSVEAQKEYAEIKNSSKIKEVSPYNVLREKQLLKVICKYISKDKKIFECGTGLGGLVQELLSLSYDVHGIDISQEMVKEAQKRLKDKNYDYSRILYDDIYSHKSERLYESCIANGVICYYKDQKKFLNTLSLLMKNESYVFITHRNALFNIFAFNEGTIDFLNSTLLDHLTSDQKENFSEELIARYPNLSTPIKKATNACLYRSSENPLEIEQLYNDSGFKIVEKQATYIHPLPPLSDIKYDYNQLEKLHIKYANDWRGLFLGSQFLVVAKKI